jgi:hypothetical protein
MTQLKQDNNPMLVKLLDSTAQTLSCGRIFLFPLRIYVHVNISGGLNGYKIVGYFVHKY